MSFSVKILWKVFFPSAEAAKITAGEKTSLFEARTGKKLLREIGGSISPTFFPLVLEPTVAFFPKLLSQARILGLSGTKNLYKVDLTLKPNEFKVGTTAKLVIHVYDKQVCLNIETESFEAPEGTDFLQLQDLASHAPLLMLAKRMIEILFCNEKNMDLSAMSLKVYPCIKISCIGISALSSQDLIRTLTRHPGANDHLINSVIAKNRIHQVDSTLTLIDRQGVLSYVPPNTTSEERIGNDRRFRSATSMLELAVALHRIMKGPPDEEIKEKISPLLASVPREIMPDSTSAQYAWGLLLDEFNLVSSFNKFSPPSNKTNSSLNEGTEMSDSPTPSQSPIAKEQRMDRTILCVAAATIELSAIHDYLVSKFGASTTAVLDGGEDYALRFHDSESETVWNVVTLSFQGASEAALEVRHFSHLLKPHIILMVGMCMGMPKRKFPVGTVVVPNEVFAFDHERLTTSGTQHRPHGDRVDNGIYRLARILGVSQSLNYKVVTDKGLATASRKVEDADTDLINFIDRTFPDVAAYDMEGWGFYRAGSGQQCLWIKSVADSGDAPEPNAEGQDKKLQIQANATDSAIDFAILLVRNYFKLKAQAKT